MIFSTLSSGGQHWEGFKTDETKNSVASSTHTQGSFIKTLHLSFWAILMIKYAQELSLYPQTCAL